MPHRFLLTAMRIATISLSWSTALLATATLAQTAPATSIALPEGPLKIKITGIKGVVRARSAPDQKWEKATEGLELSEGAELQTGPRSAVQFMIGDDQMVTLDRLGTIQILRAGFESGKVFTDLGMKYGRTRYDIESAAREHDAKVRSPSSVLAVRGTKFIAQDEAPFPARAVSLDGRVMFRDAQKLVAVGGKGAGKSRVDTQSNSPADNAMQTTVQKGKGTTEQDTQLTLQTAGYFGAANVGVTSLYDQARLQNFPVIGTIGPVVIEQLFITMNWGGPFGPGAIGSDVALSVMSPEGDVVSKTNPKPQVTGFPAYQDGPPITDPAVPGGKAVTYSTEFRSGVYTVTTTLISAGQGGSAVGVTVQPIKDPLGTANDFTVLSDTQGRPSDFTLTPENPTQVRTYQADPKPVPPPNPPASAKVKSKPAKASVPAAAAKRKVR